MKSEKGVSFSRDKRQKPSDVTRERIATDMREYNRLVKKLDSFVSMDSPSFLSWVTSTVKKATDAVKRVTNTITSTATNAFNTAKTYATRAFNTVTNYVSNAYNTAKNYAGKVFNTVKDFASDAVDKVKDTVNKVVTKTKRSVSEALDIIEETVDDVTTMVGGGINKVVETIKDIIYQFDLIFPPIFDTAMRMLADLPSMFAGFGKLMEGLFTLNEATYIDDYIKYLKLNVALGERIEKEGLG